MKEKYQQTKTNSLSLSTIFGYIFLVFACILSACSTESAMPQLGALYSKAAQTEDLGRNPVIVIPGILGSRLKDGETQTVVWGAFGGGSIDPTSVEGMQKISLPIKQGVPLSELKNGIVPDGVLSRFNVSYFGLPIELDAYRQILATLGAGGYKDDSLVRSDEVNYGSDHFTCFQHGYDWRQDISQNAKILNEFLLAKRKYVQEKLEEKYGVKDYPVKFDIVAHSMGGLLARYYLMYGDKPLRDDGSLPPVTWEGAKYVSRLIQVGTPNAGSTQAFKELVNGVEFSTLLPKYEAAILGTMPSVYELLPRPRHNAIVDINNPDKAINIYDPQEWIDREWGLADPEQDKVLKALLPDVDDAETRHKIAIDHLKKALSRAEQFSRAMDREITPPKDLSIFLMAGDAEPTDQIVGVNGKSKNVVVLKTAPGDGTVLRSSALLDERIGGTWSRSLKSPIPWNNVTFIFKDHLGLTQDAAFTDNLLYRLLEDNS